ncbi:MAG: hypothetical protein FWG16_04435, partial [Micrococcales bacterium]|nr:hypothetical protein [Micrococcales bacterium]
VLHNCPFWDSTRRYHVLCQLHAGMINGSLEEMRSAMRLTNLKPEVETHMCLGELGPAPDEPMVIVPLVTPVRTKS